MRKRPRSLCSTPATSSRGGAPSSTYSTPHSAACESLTGRAADPQHAPFSVTHIPVPHGTRRVVYPSNAYDHFTHLGDDGAFGVVFTATRRRDGTEVVVKQELLNEAADCEASMRELSVLYYFTAPDRRHPNVMELIQAWEGDNGVYLVLPRMECSLHLFLNERVRSQSATKCGGEALPEETRLVLFGQLLCGLRHMHHHGVLHRDIKPENIVLQRDLSQVKLVDFGTSRMWEENSRHTVGKYVSTYPYRAPETEQGYFSGASDIWALGCVLARMISGRTLFNRKECHLERDRKRVAERVQQLEKTATRYECELLRMMLRLDPKERIATEDLYQIHYERMKTHRNVKCRIPRVSRREVPKSEQYRAMEYEYDRVPTMRRNITVLISRCQRRLRYRSVPVTKPPADAA